MRLRTLSPNPSSFYGFDGGAAGPADEMLPALHRFYDEYHFRPKAIFRILKEAICDGRKRKRIYSVKRRNYHS